MPTMATLGTTRRELPGNICCGFGILFAVECSSFHTRSMGGVGVSWTVTDVKRKAYGSIVKT